MLNNKVFNIQSPMIPFTKKELENVISKRTTIGYVSTDYQNLIATLQRISSATEISATLNVNTIYNSTNNPIEKQDVLIKVEGTQTYNEFINNAISGDDESDYMNFITYSVLFKDTIKELKYSMYKKYLWNYHNIDTWFHAKNIGLTTDIKNKLIQDFDYFKELVLNSSDYLSFVENCSDDDIKNAVNYLIKGGLNVLSKYKVELNNHIHTMNKTEERIVLKKPIILKIFMLSTVATQCRKDWPKLKFAVLDKKSLDSIALWEE